MTLTRSLSKLEKEKTTKMQTQVIEDKIQRFLERKFRTSRSFSTRDSYRATINKFLEFLRVQYNLDFDQMLLQVNETKQKDPLEILDDFYTFLSNYKRETVGCIGFSNSTIRSYVVTIKEFLNNEGCHIYNEDLRQKFKLPKKSSISVIYGMPKGTVNDKIVVQ